MTYSECLLVVKKEEQVLNQRISTQNYLFNYSFIYLLGVVPDVWQNVRIDESFPLKSEVKRELKRRQSAWP